MNLPALRAFSAKLDGQFKLVAAPDAHRMILPELDVTEVIELPYTTSAYGKEFDTDLLSDQIGSTPLLVSLNPWHSLSMQSFLKKVDAQHSIGFFEDFNECLPLDFSKHSIELAFDPVQRVFENACLSDYLEPPKFRQEDEDLATAIIASIDSHGPVIIVHGDTLPNKMWAKENMTELIQKVLNFWPNSVVLDVGLKPCAQEPEKMPERYIHLNQIILPAGFALIKYADLFFGIDSCFLHAADFFRKPTVALFGPTDPHEFGVFMGGPAHHLKEHKLDDIAVDDVFKAVISMMPDQFPSQVVAA